MKTAMRTDATVDTYKSGNATVRIHPGTMTQAERQAAVLPYARKMVQAMHKKGSRREV